jgi:colicin import membrane protein
MNETTPYSIPKEPGRGRAIFLAALVHALLFGFFWVGIRWQNEHPIVVEAEVWDPQIKQAAPRPQPEPEPEVRPEPKPVVKEVPPPPKPVEDTPVAKKPDIALEQEKKRKEVEKKRAEEAAKQKQLAEQRLEKEKVEKAELEKKKLVAAEQLKKAEADKKRKEETDRKRKQEAADQKLREEIRKQELARFTEAAGSGGTGSAAKSQGNNRGDPAYVDRISAKIKSNINFNVPNDLAGNPPVEFEVRLLPDGSISGIRKIKSSGLSGFDEAVQRAIERSQPFPKDKSGTVPGYFNGIHRPKDQ